MWHDIAMALYLPRRHDVVGMSSWVGPQGPWALGLNGLMKMDRTHVTAIPMYCWESRDRIAFGYQNSALRATMVMHCYVNGKAARSMMAHVASYRATPCV